MIICSSCGVCSMKCVCDICEYKVKCEECLNISPKENVYPSCKKCKDSFVAKVESLECKKQVTTYLNPNITQQVIVQIKNNTCFKIAHTPESTLVQILDDIL